MKKEGTLVMNTKFWQILENKQVMEALPDSCHFNSQDILGSSAQTQDEVRPHDRVRCGYSKTAVATIYRFKVEQCWFTAKIHY